VRRVVLDTGPDSGDFPRGYTLSVSRDGQRWDDVASGSGTGQLTRIDVRPARARWLRVTQSGSAPQWWTVADLRVYR
jgi:glucosylceramidase